MATAQTIINRALRMISRIPSGGSPRAEETVDCLEALNAMLATWRNEKLMCYAFQEESLPLYNGTGSYTIGPSGTLVTVRPLDIEHAFIQQSNERYPVNVLTEDEWRRRVSNAANTADWPSVCNYRPTMPDGTLLVYPVPNASRTLKLVTRVSLTVFAAASDSVSLPPGWEDAMASNLAIRMAPEFEVEPAQAVVALASGSKAAIKKQNRQPIVAQTGLEDLFSGTTSTIFEG